MVRQHACGYAVELSEDDHEHNSGNEQGQGDGDVTTNDEAGDRQTTSLLPRPLDLLEREVSKDHADEGEHESQDQAGDGEAVRPAIVGGGAYGCGYGCAG